MYRRLCFTLISLCTAVWGWEAGAQGPVATGTSRYGLEWNYQDKNLSAMMVLKAFDTEKKGVVMNEFGLNFLEFAIDKKGKVRVAFLHPMLRRPFVKRMLRKDLRLIHACMQASSIDDVDSGLRKGLELSGHWDENGVMRSVAVQHRSSAMTLRLFVI
jgi:hypothetical protein